MKLNKHVSSDRSKSRKRHFSAPSHIRCVPLVISVIQCINVSIFIILGAV